MSTLGNIKLLQTLELGSDTASISFSGMNAKDAFLIFGSAKINGNNGNRRIHYRINNSTDNYSTYTLNEYASTYTEFGSSAFADQTYQNYGRLCEIRDNTSSNEFTNFLIQSYNAKDSTSVPLVTGLSSLGVSGNNSLGNFLGQNTQLFSEISSIQLFLSGDSFLTGSIFHVYGLELS